MDNGSNHQCSKFGTPGKYGHRRYTAFVTIGTGVQDRNFQPRRYSFTVLQPLVSLSVYWKHLIEIPTFRAARRGAELFRAERRTNYVSSVRVTCNIQIILGERSRLMRMYANNARQRQRPSWRASVHLSATRALALRRLFSPANYTVPPSLSIHRPPSLIRAKHTWPTCRIKFVFLSTER